MKKLLSLVLCSLLLCACLPGAMAEAAADVDNEAEKLTDASGNFVYVLRDDGSAELLEYINDELWENRGTLIQVIIPNTLDGHPISAVQGNPFFFFLPTRPPILFQKPCTILVDQTHPYLATIEGVLFGKTDRKLICYPRVLEADTYQVPEGVEIIGKSAFADCEKLTSVMLPNSLVRIETMAFFSCSCLASVTIPDSVSFIGPDAFADCSPDLVITVTPGSYAEQYCKENNLTYQDASVDYSDASTDC